MPEFDGQLQRSASNATLVSLDFSDGSQIRGLGIFESINGSTQPTRDSLPTANRANGYIAVVKNVNKVYVFNGVPATHWTNSANWTELGGTGIEANDLGTSVTWVDVPDENITEGSVTQHEAALTIGQAQVTDLSTDLGTIVSNVASNTSLVGANTSSITANGSAITANGSSITANGSAITANASAIATNASNITTLQGVDTALQNNINSVNTTISGLDTDDITEGNNLYNVQANWSSASGPSQILNKPQVSTDVPANAVFTDTTYSVQDGELSEKNLTTALKTQYDDYAGAITTNTAHRSLTSDNPHGTSLGQVSNVSTSGGATNDVLAQNSSGSFDLKNPFDLFMAAAETVGDFPTSGATLGDINGDGIVGIADLLIFLGNYQSSIFDISFQSITFTSMSSTPVSIDISFLNESNYNTQAALSNLTKLNIGAQTSDNSISPYDWIVNQTNDYIQFYTTDGSDISGSSGFEYFDNAKVQIANPTNLQVSVEATPDDTTFALYCYIETTYPSSTQSQLKLVGTYSVNDFDQTIDVNQDAANPIVIDHHLFAVNSGEYPTAARIYFYVGIPQSPEYGTFTCSISDLKINITQ